MSCRSQMFPQMLEEIAIVRPGGPVALALGSVRGDQLFVEGRFIAELLVCPSQAIVVNEIMQ